MPARGCAGAPRLAPSPARRRTLAEHKLAKRRVRSESYALLVHGQRTQRRADEDVYDSDTRALLVHGPRTRRRARLARLSPRKGAALQALRLPPAGRARPRRPPPWYPSHTSRYPSHVLMPARPCRPPRRQRHVNGPDAWNTRSRRPLYRQRASTSPPPAFQPNTKRATSDQGRATSPEPAA